MMDIKTPFRRTCLLRAVNESNVDMPDGKRAAPSPRDGFPFAGPTGGGGPPDHRTITIDMPARLSPRTSGLHKGGVGSPRETEGRPPSRSEHLRTLQALGIANVSDVDYIPQRGRPVSVERMKRTKWEELQGVPLAGRGADISILGGRKCRPLLEIARGRESTPKEAKTDLDSISIEHQFARRHFSAPPPAREGGNFEHALQAEDYANLLGRPEGTGKRMYQSKSQRSLSRSQQPFHVDGRGMKEGIFESPMRTQFGPPPDPPASPPPREDATPPSPGLMAALRDAARNSPAEAVWDAMRSIFAESPQLASVVDPSQVSQATAQALAVVGDGSPRRAVQRATPPKGRMDESPQRRGSPGRRSDGSAMNRNPSARSFMSASTTAETEKEGSASKAGGSLSVASAASSTGGATPTQKDRYRPVRTRLNFGTSPSLASSNGDCRSAQTAEWLREEAWKARRRAAWVA